MKRNPNNLELAKNWLLKMQNSSGGFAGSFSLIKGRRPDFPEVTGYIIPTLIKLGEIDTAKKAGEWLLSIQKPEGWFYYWPAPDRPMVFDTGQVIFGLLSLAHCHSRESGNLDPCRSLSSTPIGDEDDKKGGSCNNKYLQAAIKAGDWICSVQESDGSWIRYAYNQIPHTYYARVSWALLELWKITGDKKYKNAAVKQLDWVLAQQRPDGSFNSCSFFNDNNPVLHVVAYTIEGLLNSGLIFWICGNQKINNRYVEAARRGLKKLPPDSWSCLTGLAQLSCICFKFYELTKGRKWLETAKFINRYLKSKQILRGPKVIRGALPGSYPIWKRYMPLSLPSWSVKFWLDALIWEEKFKQNYLIAAIFPNDSLKAYLKKGELRKNYFNPDDVFSEIVIFDEENYSKEERQKLQFMMGGARWKICHLRESGDLDFRLRGSDNVFDIIRAYGVGRPAYQAYKLSKKTGVPLVISLHGNYDLDNRYYLLRRRRLIKYLYYTFRSYFVVPKILKKAAKVLVVYKFAANYALAKGVVKGKIELIYNRIYSDVFLPIGQNQEVQSSKTLINVGRLIPEKNQQCLIKAVKELDVKLIIVGQGPEGDCLKELAKLLGIANKIKFVGEIDNKRMVNLYNQADVYVTANKYGGIEIPVIEAMACGLPIIRSKHPLEREPELLGYDNCFYVENNPESFAEAIKKIMDDKKLRQQLSQRSLEIYDSINGLKMEQGEKKLVLSVL